MTFSRVRQCAAACLLLLPLQRSFESPERIHDIRDVMGSHVQCRSSARREVMHELGTEGPMDTFGVAFGHVCSQRICLGQMDQGKTDPLAMRPLRMVAEQDVQAHVDDSTAGIGCIECGFVRALCCVRLVAEHCYVRLVAEQRVVSAW